MSTYLFFIGLISILSQVVILRELNVAFYGVELIYILAIGAWLFWTGVGAVLGKRKYLPSITAVRSAFLLFTILLPCDLAFIRGIRLLFGGIYGSYLSFGQQLTGIILSLLPIGILTGLIFQWAAKLFIQENKTLALAYAIESFGGLFGGMASTLLLYYKVQNFSIALLCSILGSVFLLVSSNKKQSFILQGIITFIFLISLFFANEIDLYMTRWHHPHLIISKDSPYSRITISGYKDQFALFENNALVFETQTTESEEFVHLAGLNVAKPNSILVLGGGIQGIVDEILKHLSNNKGKIDYVEINSVLPDIAKKYLPEKFTQFLKSDNVVMHHADPREFLTHSNYYDLILVSMGQPDSGQSNRFYTLEYFKQCAARLNLNGVLAFSLRSSENLWSQVLSQRNATIFTSLKSVFKDVVVLPGTNNIVLASQSFFAKNPDILVNRFISRKISAKLVTPDYIRYLYTNDRFAQIADYLSSVKTIPNTDIHPVCYQYSCIIWLSKFIPGLMHKNVIPEFKIKNFYLLIVFLILITKIFKIKYPKSGSILLAGLAGFSGMMLETMILLYYQAKSGALFQNIGILLMIFMAGLALGAFIIEKLAKYDIDMKKIGKILILGFGIFNLIFANLLYSGYFAGIFTISILLFITGFMVSGIFAYASLSELSDQKNIVSPIYASDMLGSCIASISGTLFFIPFLGMGVSAVIISILLFISLIL